VVVIPDYRLHPEVQFPAFIQDGAAAVAWAHANAARFGGDPRRLFLMGHSAGAQIATLLALDRQYLRDAGLAPARDVCGVIGLAGPYDFLPHAKNAVKAVFGPEEEWPRAQPINYVTPLAPPMLLLAGDADRSVDPGNTLRLAARLHAAGADVRSELEPGISHRAIVVALADPLSFLAPVRARTLDFIADQGSCQARISEASAARSRSAPAIPE
jgi:acetyl esterase/lipase